MKREIVNIRSEEEIAFAEEKRGGKEKVDK